MIPTMRLALLASVAGFVDAAASARRSWLAARPHASSTCGSMYVAVFSRRETPSVRKDIRKLWREVGQDFGNVTAEFVLCQPHQGEAASVAAAIREEQMTYGDVRVMDCEDGYLNGTLTKKAAAAMKVFVEEYGGSDYFMKTDDDTFASFRRICDLLTWRDKHGKDNSHLYAGVFAEGPENMHTKHPPCRDPESPWYEPVSNFPGDFYPTSAKGGPGYILGAGVVKEIISTGTAAKNIINNEDKAVGVWVDALVKQGKSIAFLNIPGTDGYDEHKKWTVTSGTYGNYPHYLHHHLNGSTIACLHEIDIKRDPAVAIDGCFASP